MRVKGQYVLPKILATLGNAAVAVGSGGSHTSTGAYRMFRTFDALQEISDKKLRQSVHYAIDKKFIKVTFKNGTKHIEVTAEGRKILGRAAIEALKLSRRKTWDHVWRIVLFDIPETHKKGRDGFAANLKRIGFIHIQKSAFVFPHPCIEELEVLADFHDVAKFLNFIEARSVSNDEKLRKHFKL